MSGSWDVETVCVVAEPGIAVCGVAGVLEVACLVAAQLAFTLGQQPSHVYHLHTMHHKTSTWDLLLLLQFVVSWQVY